MLENYRRLGWAEATILANYPTLATAYLAPAWAYVEAHTVDRRGHPPERGRLKYHINIFWIDEDDDLKLPKAASS
jgi:hypothetical protein